MLAGCYGPPSASPSRTAALPPSAGSGRGIDMATDASDVVNELKDARVEFVSRYYRDPDSGWPPLSPSEAAALGVRGSEDCCGL